VLLVSLVAKFEQEIRETDIIFYLAHGNVTNFSRAFVDDCEFFWLEIGICLIKKAYVFDTANERATCIVLFVENCLYRSIPFCFPNWFLFRLKLHAVSLERRDVEIKPVNLSEMIFWIECD